jgi:hypothetical protein
MILHPAILSLLISSLLITGLVLYSARIGVTILARWNLASGSERQLELERRTYLVSTVLANAFAFQLVSLFLYIFTADSLHGQFIGAMCAAGTLNVDGAGYPALVLKIGSFVLAGVWLILNHADNRAYDYPLVRVKYLLLVLLAPVLVAELLVQSKFLLALEPNVITSCCGSLFASDARGVTSDLAALPIEPTMVAFYLTVGATCAALVVFLRWGWGGALVGGASLLTLVVSLASVISWISLYYYEMPTHHCPFDILQRGYGYVGYLLYGLLGGGVLAGLGVGVLTPFRSVGSLEAVVPRMQRRLAVGALVLLLLFALIVTVRVATSDLVLIGA